MKKVLIITAVIICLFIPTYIAIYLYSSAQITPVSENSVTALDITAPDGKTYSFTAGSESGEKMIALFLNINKNSKSTPSLPKDLEGADCYTAKYHSYDLLTEYKYYFSRVKPSNSYYTDNEGRAFRIDASYTIEFLDGDYSAALYKELSVTPVLTVCGQTITPYHLSWKYYSYSSVAHDVTSETSSDKTTVTASYSSIPVALSIFPDRSSITVSNSGEKLFEGSLSAFAENGYLSNEVRADMKLDVSIEAEWNDNPSLGFGGRAEYSFVLDCVYDPPARFSLGTSVIDIDEFVILTGTNIEDPSAITFSSDPGICFEPKFYTDGEYVRSAIPVSSMLGAGPGTYVFRITYAEKTTELTLTVKESKRVPEVRKYNYSNKVNTAVRTPANLAAFAEFIVSCETSDSPLFTGPFLFDDLGNNRAAFGDTVNNGAVSEQFTSKGLAFVCYEKQAVKAVNNGRVVAVGVTKYGGNTVVVDHGWGIRSVYYCLRTVSVTTGDFVVKGNTIGLGASATGYSDGITAYIELWLDNAPVSYYDLVKDNGYIPY